jgi:tRNA (guanine26-N2/guanine27-N2)-dimethyltransferase
VYQSTQCPSFHVVPHGQKSNRRNVWQPCRAPLFPVCQETGGPFKTAGPIWLGPLHDQSVVADAIARLQENSGPSILQTRRNILGLLTVVSEELNVPLYYSLSSICKTLSCAAPPIDYIRAAIINAGYKVSSYHKDPEAIKTDAPNHVLWDVFRCWCKNNHPSISTGDISQGDTDKKKKRKKDNVQKSNVEDEADDEEEHGYKNAREKILSVEPKLVADFTLPEVLKQTKKKQLRFPANPEPNWGPKPKAVGYSRKNE